MLTFVEIFYFFSIKLLNLLKTPTKTEVEELEGSEEEKRFKALEKRMEKFEAMNLKILERLHKLEFGN